MVWKPSHRREMQDGTRKFNFKLKANIITRKEKHVKSAPHVNFIIITACRPTGGGVRVLSQSSATQPSLWDTTLTTWVVLFQF